jgi:hypothetical protein
MISEINKSMNSARPPCGPRPPQNQPSPLAKSAWPVCAVPARGHSALNAAVTVRWAATIAHLLATTLVVRCGELGGLMTSAMWRTHRATFRGWGLPREAARRGGGVQWWWRRVVTNDDCHTQF